MALADTAALIASLTLEDKFSRPAKNIEGSLGRLESGMSRIGSQATRGVSTAIGNIARIGVVAGGALAAGIGVSIKQASDLNEEIDKSKVVFGAASDEVLAFSRNAATIGLATSEALGAAGAFGNMFNTVGLAQDKSADMSTTMVQLAADMASFNNEDPSEMLLRLRSGLAGEAEPLRRFGVLLSEARVKEFAYRNGIAATGEALTEAQKVQARYGLILEDTAIQQGNFAKTSKGVANQTRQLRANLKNVAAAIGTAFLPTLSRLGIRLNELFIQKQPQIIAFGERLGTALDRIFTDERISAGMGRLGDFIDRLAEGDVGNVVGQVEDVVRTIAGLPWQAIGDAARLLGTGSKALLDAFLGLPPWVQTAVLTGWGLNKLTGGALSGIVGQLASGLVRGILGINAGVVNLRAGTVVGGGGAPIGGGGAGGLLVNVGKFLGGVTLGLIAFEIAKEIGKLAIFNPTVAPAVSFEQQQFNRLVASGDTERMRNGLGAIESAIRNLESRDPLGIFLGDQLNVLREQRDTLKGLLAAATRPPTGPGGRPTGPIPSGSQPIPVKIPASPTNDLSQSRQFLRNIQNATGDTERTATQGLATSKRANALTDTQIGQDRYASALRGGEALRAFFLALTSLGVLRQIAAKNFSPTIVVKSTTNTNISGRTVASSYLEQRLRVGSGPQEF
jgi:hypothetical protein